MDVLILPREGMQPQPEGRDGVQAIITQRLTTTDGDC
jgi:hypothetical protein